MKVQGNVVCEAKNCGMAAGFFTAACQSANAADRAPSGRAARRLTTAGLALMMLAGVLL